MKRKAVALFLAIFLFTGLAYSEEVHLLFEDEDRDIAFACSINFPVIPDYYDSKRVDGETCTLLVYDMGDLIIATDEDTGIHYIAMLYYPYYYTGSERSAKVENTALSWIEKEISQEPEVISREDISFPNGLSMAVLKKEYEEENQYSAKAIWYNADFCISLTAIGEDTAVNRLSIDTYVASLELDYEYDT